MRIPPIKPILRQVRQQARQRPKMDPLVFISGWSWFPGAALAPMVTKYHLEKSGALPPEEQEWTVVQETLRFIATFIVQLGAYPLGTALGRRLLRNSPHQRLGQTLIGLACSVSMQGIVRPVFSDKLLERWALRREKAGVPAGPHTRPQHGSLAKQEAGLTGFLQEIQTRSLDIRR